MPNNPRLPSGASFSDRNRSVSQQPRQPATSIAHTTSRERSISENIETNSQNRTCHQCNRRYSH